MKTIFLLAEVATAMKAPELLFIIFVIIASIVVIVMILRIINAVDKKVQKNLSEQKNSRRGYLTEEKPQISLNDPSNLPEGCVKCNDRKVIEFLHEMYLVEMDIIGIAHFFKEYMPKFKMDIIHSLDKKDAWDYCYSIATKKGKILIFRSLEKRRTVPPVVYIQGDVHIEQVRNMVEIFCHKVLCSIEHVFKKVHHRH